MLLHHDNSYRRLLVSPIQIACSFLHIFSFSFSSLVTSCSLYNFPTLLSSCLSMAEHDILVATESSHVLDVPTFKGYGWRFSLRDRDLKDLEETFGILDIAQIEFLDCGCVDNEGHRGKVALNVYALTQGSHFVAPYATYMTSFVLFPPNFIPTHGGFFSAHVLFFEWFLNLGEEYPDLTAREFLPII